MKQFIIHDTEDHITPEAVKASATNKIRAGSVLIVTRSGILRRTLPVAVNQTAAAINQDLKALEVHEGVEARYVAWALRRFEDEIRHSCVKGGTTVQSVEFPRLLKFEIPLAPSTEQGRIVEALEEQLSRLDAGVEALRRAQRNLKRMRTAVLRDAMEGRLVPQSDSDEHAEILLKRVAEERGMLVPPHSDAISTRDLPPGWTWASSHLLFTFITSGSRGWAKYYSDNGPLFLRIGNLERNSIHLDLSRIQHVLPPGGAEGTRTRVRPGDILISVTADLGMIALIPEGLPEAYINQHIALARPVHHLWAPYIAWFLASSNGQRQLWEKRRGATKIGLGLDDIRSVLVPLPPVAEQQRIATEIERYMSVLDAIEGTLRAAERRDGRLRYSILVQAFEGGLVPQDASDAWASSLLEQIETAGDAASTPRAGRTRRSRS